MVISVISTKAQRKKKSHPRARVRFLAPLEMTLPLPNVEGKSPRRNKNPTCDPRAYPTLAAWGFRRFAQEAPWLIFYAKHGFSTALNPDCPQIERRIAPAARYFRNRDRVLEINVIASIVLVEDADGQNPFPAFNVFDTE